MVSADCSRNSPRSPTTFTVKRGRAVDHIEQWIRPVCPPANRNWAVIARSISGPRSFACAETTSGVEPPNLRTMSTA